MKALIHVLRDPAVQQGLQLLWRDTPLLERKKVHPNEPEILLCVTDYNGKVTYPHVDVHSTSTEDEMRVYGEVVPETSVSVTWCKANRPQSHPKRNWSFTSTIHISRAGAQIVLTHGRQGI